MIPDSRPFARIREPLTLFDRLFLLSLASGLVLFWAIVGLWALRQVAA